MRVSIDVKIHILALESIYQNKKEHGKKDRYGISAEKRV